MLQQQQAASQLSPFQQLAADPQMQQMIQLVRSNPSMLQPLLQELQNSNPQLLQFITEHQTEFQQLLNGEMPMPAPGGAPAPGGGAPPGQVTIQLTQEEHETITR